MKEAIKFILAILVVMALWGHNEISDTFGPFTSWQFWLSLFVLFCPAWIVIAKGIDEIID